MVAILNRHDVDSVDVEFIQTGPGDEASVTLSDDLLDGTKTYLVAIEELSVSASAIPVNRLAAGKLFTVYKRNVGQTIELESQMAQGAPAAGVDCNLERVSSAQGLVDLLRNFARGFKARYKGGIPNLALFGGPHDALDAGAAIVPPLVEVANGHNLKWFDFALSSDGRLVMELSAHFLNNFFIEFTRLGQNLLTLETLPVEHNRVDEDDAPNMKGVEEHLYIVATGNDFTAAFVNNQNKVIAGDNTRTHRLVSKLRLFETFDTRHKVDIESHFSIPSSVEVRDGVQRTSRALVEKYFPKKITVTTDGANNTYKISANLYGGQVPIVTKNDKMNWFKLRSAYNLRFMRFHVFVHYREYNSSTNTWKVSRKLVNLKDGEYYRFGLRFVSIT